jgi:hypothetical protein
MRNLIFIVFINDSIIEINGEVDFGSLSRNHYMDLFLPFVMYDPTIKSGSMNLTGTIHQDAKGESSLLHIDITESGGYGSFSFRIHVGHIVAVAELGQERIMLTFGNAESSYRLMSMNQYRGKQPMDVSTLTPFIVQLSAGNTRFFSSDCYLPPGVEYFTNQSRIASWYIDFSGPLSSFYRSIDCTIVEPRGLQLRQFLIFLSGAAVAIGANVLLKPYFQGTTEGKSGRLLYLRIRHKFLQALGRWRR